MMNLNLFTYAINIMKAGGMLRFPKTPGLSIGLDEHKGLFCVKDGVKASMNNALFNGLFHTISSSYRDVVGIDVFNLLSHVGFQESVALFVTTNGEVKQDGTAIMGKGIAKQAAALFGREVPVMLGKYLSEYGNRVFNLGNYVIGTNCVRLFSFPTKYSWRDGSDLTLITKSLEQSKEVMEKFDCTMAFLPCPGIGNGGLPENIVRPVLDIALDSRYFVCFK